MRLPGGVWWLPVPFAGNRLDLGRGYEAYRLSAPFAKYTAIWRRDTPAKVKLLFADPTKVTVADASGQPVPTKLQKDGIELTLDTTPLVITGTEDIPVPYDSVVSLQADYKALISQPSAQDLRLGDFRFLFENSVQKLKENPAGAFVSMMDAFRKMQIVIGMFCWVEGEAFEETNFGHVYSSPACSAERALGLKTALAPTSAGYFATYRMPTKFGACDLWIAASIPAKTRPYVEVIVNNMPFSLPDKPLSFYGSDFAWFKVATLQLQPGTQTVSIRIRKEAPLYAASIDAVLLTPFNFRPDGPRLPDFQPN
jgi:hypothetical protein